MERFSLWEEAGGRRLGAVLKGMPIWAYLLTVEVKGIVVEAMAEIETVGKSLRFNNITIYSQQGDVPNQIGPLVFFRWARMLKKQAKEQGFEEIQFHGQRAAHSTSANPGMMIDQIISLK